MNITPRSIERNVALFGCIRSQFVHQICWFYLQKMSELKEPHPDIHQQFESSHHITRRSNRHWAGLSTDLVIEQVLRSMKSTGGLTQVGNVGEAKTSWLLSMSTGLRLTMQCKISLVFNTSQVISTRRWANPGRSMTLMIQKKFGTTLERRIHFIMAIHHCVTLQQEELLPKKWSVWCQANRTRNTRFNDWKICRWVCIQE